MTLTPSHLASLFAPTIELRRRPAFGYGFAVVLVAIALVSRFALEGALPPTGFPFLTFFPAVLLAAFFGGLRPGLTASVLSTLAAWYFFVPAANSFAFASTADIIVVAFFACILLIDCVVIDIMNRTLERNVTLAAELAQRVDERTQERDRLWRLSRDLFLITDFEGRIVSANPAWTDLLGWSPQELASATFPDLVHPEDAGRTHEEVKGLADGRATMRFENRYRAKDGSYRWLSWTATSNDGLMYGVARDVTADKNSADALRSAEEQLRQSQKMEAVGQLTGGIAHDFNNMLAVVIGSLDMLKRRMVDGEVRHLRLVQNAMEGATRAAGLTQRLLAFSRQQALKPEPIDANKLVSGMSELLRRTITENIRLETVLAGGLWRTSVDPNQLESAILNLAVNARDAMPDGGRLTIETANCHLDETYSREHETAAGQYVLIAVSDTGTGMTTDVVARAFDPFYTTKEVNKGTGLGLSMVHGFVRQTGGHAKIYSEAGQGTTVKIYLPRLVAVGGVDPARLAAPAEPSELPKGSPGEIVLVVEDEDSVRLVTVEALRELGYTVIHANGGNEALRKLDETPNVSLLFTDVVMPDMNGRQLADEAKKRHPKLRLLFTTGYTRNAIVHNGVLDHGVVLVSKPFTIEQLALHVREVLDESGDLDDDGRPLSDLAAERLPVTPET